MSQGVVWYPLKLLFGWVLHGFMLPWFEDDEHNCKDSAVMKLKVLCLSLAKFLRFSVWELVSMEANRMPFTLFFKFSVLVVIQGTATWVQGKLKQWWIQRALTLRWCKIKWVDLDLGQVLFCHCTLSKVWLKASQGEESWLREINLAMPAPIPAWCLSL